MFEIEVFPRITKSNVDFILKLDIYVYFGYISSFKKRF